MSYILDALKKSERERSRTKLQELSPRPRPTKLRNNVWLGASIALALVLAMIMLILILNVQLTPVYELGMENEPFVGRLLSFRWNKGNVPVSAQHPSRSWEKAPQLAGLKLEALSYSEYPARRFVMLNQRVLREGEAFSGNIVLREITRDAAIVNIDGAEFLLRPD